MGYCVPIMPLAASTARDRQISRMHSPMPSAQPQPTPQQHTEAEPTATAQAARRQALYITLAQVPAGKVVSYGQLADLAGLGRAARWVGRTLSQLPEGSTLPWHRVIAASGHLSLPAGSASGAEQRARLRDEGVAIANDRVDIRRHGWRPMEHSG
jgi:methylated-DNA-protein-cysteine methyltransferase-like protein